MLEKYNAEISVSYEKGANAFDSICSLSSAIWQKYRHLPYGSAPKHGKSTLKYQLTALEDMSKRDCKLPTFALAKELVREGIDFRIAVQLKNGTHPFIYTEVPGTDLTCFISFYPSARVCKFLTRSNGNVVRWDEVVATGYLANRNLEEVPFDDNGLDWLDRRYLLIDEEIRSDS